MKKSVKKQSVLKRKDCRLFLKLVKVKPHYRLR